MNFDQKVQKFEYFTTVTILYSNIFQKFKFLLIVNQYFEYKFPKIQIFSYC